jgi:hypothetical protein
MKRPPSIIYKLIILGLVYVGRTARTFEKRLTEHMYNAWYRDGKKYRYNTPLYKIIRENNITDISKLEGSILETRVPHSRRDIIEQKWMIKLNSVHNGLNGRFNNISKISKVIWKNMSKPTKTIGKPRQSTRVSYVLPGHYTQYYE